MDFQADLIPEKEKSKKRDKTTYRQTEPSGSMDSPIKVKKSGGWAEEGTKMSKSKSSTNVIEQERFESYQRSPIDDIPVLPDADDIIEDAPDIKIATTTVKKSTYKELDKINQLDKLKKVTNFGNLDDIDVSILIPKSYSEKEVKDNDDVWTMDSIFNDIRSLAS